jgi:hypothetical protein
MVRIRDRVLVLVSLVLAADLALAGTDTAPATEDSPKMYVKEVRLFNFQSHRAGNPTTVGHLRFNFEPAPGNTSRSYDDNFALSTLSIGIGERFEVGTVPLLSLFGQTPNLTMKFNFYRTDEISLAVGYSLMRFVFGEHELHTHGLTVYGSLALHEDLYIGTSLTSQAYWTSNKILAQHLTEIPLDVSKFLDLSHYITNEVSFAVGVSHTKNVLFLGSHQVFYQYGAGATIYYQDNKERFFFSKVGLGIHKYVRTGRSFYLLHLAL